MSDFRTRLTKPELHVVPGVYDAFGALLAQRAGFEALYVSGASLSYTRLGRPDIGLMSMAEVADSVGRIRERCDADLIVDADTGFGNALNVQRTVALLERMGASVIQIEDQVMPKRCGHLSGKSVVSSAEMVGKIHAALDARQSEDTLIMARTDAIAVEGFEPALERAEKNLEAGADILFVEAPESVEQMREICDRFAGRVPLLANMVEGGRTPVNDINLVAELGYRIAIFPGAMVRIVAGAIERYVTSLAEHGDTRELRDSMLEFGELQDLLGTSEMLAAGEQYENEA